jgi:hypothetical protein
VSVDQHQDLDQHRQTGIYVYGLVPADVETDPEATGVGDPPAAVEVVRHGDIAALTSEIPTDHQLGRPDDLRAHAELLDRAAAEVPVLPIRFGGVMASADAVIEELLKPYHDEFRSALDELDGCAEFLVRGRYVEAALFKEILSENEEAVALREQIRGKPEDATRNERIALGELIDWVIAVKREADTRTAVNVVLELTEKVSVREATHEHEAVHVACLLESGRQAELEHVVDDLSDMWRDRISLSLLGPMAAYDFVVTHQPEE